MPDLIREYRRWCSSNEQWSTIVHGSKNSYTVTYGKVNFGDYEYGYTCTCKAFEFGQGKECKHIIEAKKQHCRFNHEACCGDGEEVKDDTCPKCGADMTTIVIMVQ